MKKTNIIILTLSIIGIFLSSYLWAFQVTDNIIPCSSSGCAHVLSDPHSFIFGVPMAAFGVAFYIALAYLAFQRFYIKHKVLKYSMSLLIFSGLIFSLYLRYLEFFVIKQGICQWCWGSFIIVLIISGLNLYEHKKNV